MRARRLKESERTKVYNYFICRAHFICTGCAEKLASGCDGACARLSFDLVWLQLRVYCLYMTRKSLDLLCLKASSRARATLALLKAVSAVCALFSRRLYLSASLIDTIILIFILLKSVN